MKVTVRREERAPSATGPEVVEGMSVPEPAAATPGRTNLMRIEAPMVGTFYRAPEPGGAPFVNEGDIVVPGQTLCILEAMKLMNEVKTEIEGQVKAILVDNAQPVEYGQLLFELEPVDGRPPAF